MSLFIYYLLFCTIVLPDPDSRPQSGWKGHHGGNHVWKPKSYSSCWAPSLHLNPTCRTALFNTNPSHRTPVLHTLPSTGKNLKKIICSKHHGTMISKDHGFTMVHAQEKTDFTKILSLKHGSVMVIL